MQIESTFHRFTTVHSIKNGGGGGGTGDPIGFALCSIVTIRI